MFKRKFTRSRFSRRSTSRKLPARIIPKSIARVRTDWVTLYNVTGGDLTPGGTGCSILFAPWSPVSVLPEGPQCFSTFGHTIITSETLSDLYGDDVKIVAMVGDYWMKPVFEAIDLCSGDAQTYEAYFQATSNYFIRARGGLVKQRVVEADRVFEGVARHPLMGRDWSDAGFLKTFERNWAAPPSQLDQYVYGPSAFIGAIGDTHRNSYVTPATASGDQPSFNVPAIITDCHQCFMGGEDCTTGAYVRRTSPPGWKRVSISSRKTIHMKEDDSLAWYVDWASLNPPTDGEGAPFCNINSPNPAPCGMHIIPSLKVKLQYG